MSGENKNEEWKKSGEGMEMIRSMRKEQRDSDAEEEVFCLWRFW